ncbi:LGFP repeat-containing protein [Kitasatospora sp. NPDC056184]|uniref:LGFP repeat-containing protein n=1 Tax=Kitasatospora sp. NPDC056184 TaxID=3345738 RepID=UPI0035E24CFE
MAAVLVSLLAGPITTVDARPDAPCAAAGPGRPAAPARWAPTGNPQPSVVPGRMRSDCGTIPSGFTKEQADRAEVMEAALAAGSADGRPRASAAADCRVYWPAPYEVCGAIREKYDELGGPNGFLLYPTSDELTNPDGQGKRSVFQNGPIYWSPAGGAHPVVNHFFAAWQRNGWEAGPLGYPTSDEIVNPDAVGRRQYFQGGTIYWHLNEAYYVTGAIRDKWGETGWEGGPLGYPAGDEILLPDGRGRMSRFEHGVVHWSPDTGAHPVTGAVLDQWSRAGYEASAYGYPTEDPVTHPGGVLEQQFQHDRLYSSGVTVPVAPGVSLSLGVPSAGPLRPAVVSDGVVLSGPGFDARFQRLAEDGSFEVSLVRLDPSAPTSVDVLLGAPADYTLRATAHRVELVDPAGAVVAGVGLPLGFDSTGAAVPVRASLDGNRLRLHLGDAAAYPIAFPAVAARGDALDQWWSTGVQQRSVCEGEPYDCYRVRNARGPAFNLSKAAFPEATETDDNRIDAARHCIWNGLMTEGANRGFAERMAAAHERDGQANPDWTRNAQLMDEYNNRTGVQVGLRNEGAPAAIESTCLRYGREARIVPEPDAIDLTNPYGTDLIALRHP